MRTFIINNSLNNINLYIKSAYIIIMKTVEIVAAIFVLLLVLIIGNRVFSDFIESYNECVKLYGECEVQSNARWYPTQDSWNYWHEAIKK